jgi:hypothetical protein
VELSEEDKALEERLRKLRESSHKSAAPSYSEEEMRAKLEALRDEVASKKDGGGEVGKDTDPNPPDSHHSGTTQTEQADRLLEQATDETRIDSRLRHDNEGRDEELLKRYQDLKGTTGKGGRGGAGLHQNSTATEPNAKLNYDIAELFDTMDDPVLPEEDAEKLLQDLRSFQAKEERTVEMEVHSEDVQQLINAAKKLAKDEETRGTGDSLSSDDPLPTIVYPNLAGLEAPNHKSPTQVSPGAGEVSSAEVAKMLEEGRGELQRDQEQHQTNVKFAEQASERLHQLRRSDGEISHDLPEDEVVKSKPKTVSTVPPNLEFTWSHFEDGGGSSGGGASYNGNPGGASGENREQFDGEVQQLIARMLEEAELDRRLEASGLKYQTEDRTENNPTEVRTQTDKPPPPGAVALSPVRTAAGPVGGASAGACGGLDDDDLPWCCICNDDATISCYDCDGDIYCQRCFADGHQRFGLVDHKYAPFNPPNK